MAISSDEVNFLIYRYLQESGFLHSAFTFAYESQLAKSSVIDTNVPPGALVSFIQKGLQYVSVEAHVNEDGSERECEAELSLLSPHVCSIVSDAQSGIPAGAMSDPTSAQAVEDSNAAGKGKPSNKRKRKNPTDSSPDTIDDSKDVNGTMEVAEEDPTLLLSGHEQEVYNCAWHPVQDILVTGSSDSTARMWHVSVEAVRSQSAPSPPFVLHHEGGAKRDITTLEWNKDGSLLATGSVDGRMRIWTAEGELSQVCEVHNGPVFAARWSPTHPNLLLSASFDKTVALWDATAQVKKAQLSVHHDPIMDAAWQNADTLATCSSDHTLSVLRLAEDSASFSVLGMLHGHEESVNSLAFHPTKNNLLASCSDDRTLRIWDVDNIETEESVCVKTFKGHDKEVYAFRWSNNGNEIVSASFDTTVKVWDVETTKCRRTLDHSNGVYGVAYSPDGEYIASGTIGGRVTVWSVKDGSVVKTWQVRGDVYDVAWHRSGDVVAACLSSGDVALLSLKS